MHEDDKHATDYPLKFRFADLNWSQLDSDPLVSMIQQFLIDLQRIGTLCVDGTPVTINGFILNNDPNKLYNLGGTRQDEVS